eukprot:750574-Hanusia_phi.AAC.2
MCIRVVEENPLRRRGSNSCVVCKKAKVKCDEDRPCSRCKRLKRESRCVYEQMSLIQALEEGDEGNMETTHNLEQGQGEMVGRPLDFWIRSISFDKPSQLREHMTSMGWPDRVLARHWEFGFSAKEMMNIFLSLPPYLKQVTRRALHAIEIIVTAKMDKQARAQPGQLLIESEVVTEAVLELEQAFYGRQSFGVVKQHVHPDTMKRAHVYVSDAACALMGMHAEEALARIANRELPLLVTEFGFLCYVMFGTWSFATRPGRPFTLVAGLRRLGESGESGGTMTRLDQLQEFNGQGRVSAIKSYFTAVKEAKGGRGGDTAEEEVERASGRDVAERR